MAATISCFLFIGRSRRSRAGARKEGETLEIIMLISEKDIYNV